MQKLHTLIGVLVLGLLSITNANAEYYAFGGSTFYPDNYLIINSTNSAGDFNLPQSFSNIDSGWINSNGYHQGGNTSYYSGEFDVGGSYPTENYFSFNLAGLSGTLVTAVVQLGLYTVTVPAPYDIYATSLTPAQVDSGNTFTSIALYDALTSGPEIGTFDVFPDYSNEFAEIILNSAGVSWLQANEGGSVVVGGVFLGDAADKITPEPSSLILFGTGIAGMAGMLRRKYAR